MSRRKQLKSKPPQFTSTSTGPADVLTLLAPREHWVNYRGPRIADFLRSEGISWGWMTIHRQTIEELKGRIEQYAPRIVINDAWAIPPEQWEILVRDMPGIDFVALNHSHPSQCLSHSGLCLFHREFERIATHHENAWYGLVPPVGEWPFSPFTRTIQLPNVAVIPYFKTFERSRDSITVSLISRIDPVKNIGAQIGGIIHAARHTPKQIRALLSFDAPGLGIVRDWVGLLESAGVSTVVTPFLPWEKYLTTVNSHVDIGLCCSHAETFGLAAFEHCALGKPIVASDAITWSPERWRATPQSAFSIGEKILQLDEDWQSETCAANGLAFAVAKSNHERLITNLANLLP